MVTRFPELKRVLIVGAGLSGSALASVFERGGVEVCLLEKRLPSVDFRGAGVLLTANAMMSLDKLGFGEQVREKGRVTDSIMMFDELGEALYSISCNDCGRGTPFVSIRHSVLLDILRNSLGNSPRYQTSLRSVSNAACGEVEFDDGSTETFDLVVGADGSKSDIRRNLFDNSVAERQNSYTGYRFVTTCPETVDRSQHYFGNGVTILLYPLPNNEVYCGAGPISNAALVEGEDPVSTIRNTFSHFPRPVLDVLAELDSATSIVRSTFWSVDSPTWQNGKCVLIGDAAHAMPPTLSQGAAMAFEDVQVLAECLSRGGVVFAKIREFTRRRIPRVDELRKQSVSRLHANRMVDRRRYELASRVYSSVGKSSLETLWTKLTKVSP